MRLRIGVKSDPIEYRYSFEWLFSLLREEGVELVQLGSFFELYLVDDGFFHELKALADSHGISIRSCFTAHRELGGAFTGNPFLADVAGAAYERYIAAGGILGADYVGSNPGAVYRDKIDEKEKGTAAYLAQMKTHMVSGRRHGLKGLTIEPMSCLAEPPSAPGEIARFMRELGEYHRCNPDTTVPVYLCGDISHGLADSDRNVIHGNMELFRTGIPHMAEFHFKNTDRYFESTFGFSAEERLRGIVDLKEVKRLIYDRADSWPVDEVTGYLEIGGPKLGRDYSDPLLGDALRESLDALRDAFGPF